MSAVRGSYSHSLGCEPLDSFLGQFGNQWDTDCVDIYNNGTGIEQPAGTSCYAQCRENNNEQYLYCSCNHDNCFWVPNDIHMDQVSYLPSKDSSSETGDRWDRPDFMFFQGWLASANIGSAFEIKIWSYGWIILWWRRMGSPMANKIPHEQRIKLGMGLENDYQPRPQVTAFSLHRFRYWCDNNAVICDLK